jgi:hypothetical protein
MFMRVNSKCAHQVRPPLRFASSSEPQQVAVRGKTSVGVIKRRRRNSGDYAGFPVLAARYSFSKW